MFSVGDKIGVYEIVAELKSGGMASLFLGRRAGAAGFAKLVAIKVVHEHLAEDPIFVQMFVDEALLGARIQHPNVVHVEELREIDGRHFLVMEYVHGCSLGQLTRALAKQRRRMSPELAMHIAIKVADGLHAAHEARDETGQNLGVVHRDVSPQNILLSYQGNVKLIDFGVAKAAGRMQQTSGGSIKGKFRYMSPEHAYAKSLDRRSDVYALGVVLWEMLTMRRRFDGRTDLDILNAVRHPDVLPASRFAEDLPPGLDEILMKAMAVSPDDRFQTARALRDALVDLRPRAASLHESALGALLAALMADRIAKDRAALPSSVSGLTLDMPKPDLGPDVLETVTLSAGDIEVLESGDTGDSLAGQHDAPTMVLPEIGMDGPEEATVLAGPPEDMALAPDVPAAAFAAPPAASSTPSVAAAPAEGVRVHPAVLAIGVLAILLVAGGGSFFTVVHLMSSDGPRATTTVVPPPSVGRTPPTLAEVPALPDEVVVVDAGPPAAAARPDAGAPIAARPPRPDPTPTETTGRRRRGPAEPTTGGGRRRRGRPIASEW